jgi:4-hydroxy-2-oxoheptanedioate aldolase
MSAPVTGSSSRDDRGRVAEQSTSGSEGASQREGLAARIAAREPLAGLLVKMPCAAVIEVAGYAGFDFVVIDTEHGGRDSQALEHHLRAADVAGVPALVRIPRNNGHEMLFALDAGATGLVVPRVVDVADVDRVVDAALYPPAGTRGLALSTRAGRQGLRSVEEHLEHARRNTVLVVQIEDVEAIPNAAAIAAHPHADAVFIGPSDLSSALGHPGRADHPEVQAAIDEIAAAVLAQERTALCTLATSAPAVAALRERGNSMTVFSAEVLIAKHLAQLAADIGQRPRQLAR